MPTPTDLVTDLPADFEVFGQAVDSTMADLKGGTTGQVLSKNSNTDMDFVWVTDAGGDITGVTAGTGISGGGTSGTVTVTNSMATAIDAKGDLIAGTGADAFTRVAVGTNNQVLTADSTASGGVSYTNKGWTLISQTTLTGASVTLSSIPQSYQSLKLIVTNVSNATADGRFRVRPNAAVTSFYISGIENGVVYGGAALDLQTQANVARGNLDNVFNYTFDQYNGTVNSVRNVSGNYYYGDSAGATRGSIVGGMCYMSAITSLVISNTGGNFSTGTAFLYGVA